MVRWARAASVAAALASAGASHAARAEEPLGAAPTYATRAIGVLGAGAVPNAAAMTRQIWAPGLDDGFVPQGLTAVDGAVYIAAYQSTERSKGRGPCRIFRIDPETGTITAVLDLPPACGHAGGLARGATGHIWAVDTHVMLEIALETGGNGHALGRIVREVKLEPPVKGSFAAGDGTALWLGGYERDKPGRLFRIPLTAIAGAAVGAALAERAIEIPARAQGAAIDTRGGLWITRSGAALGELLRLDPGTGAVKERYVMPGGIEDISFDRTGAIWAVSEAGSRRWSDWATHFPVVFRLDPAKLR